MEKMAKKGMAALVGLALISVAGLAQAETRFAVQDTSGVDKMVVTDTGFIGTGTNNPQSALHLNGNTIEGSQIRSQMLSNTNTWSGGIAVLRNRTTSAGALALPAAGDRLGYILFGGVDGATTRYPAGFFAYSDGAWSATSTPAYYVFETTRVGKNSRDEWMRITSSGNIGIGTPSPRANLEVNGGLRLIATPTVGTPTAPARTAPVRPVCDSTNGPNIRGTFWFNQGGVGTADTVSVCAKDAAGNYDWRTISFAP